MTSRCDHCGSTEPLELLELFGGRAPLFDWCCEERELEARDDLEAGYRDELYRAAVHDAGFTSSRGLAESGGALVVDHGLELREVDLRTAKAFVRKHHTHRAAGRDEHTPPISWRWGHALYNGRDLVAVAMVGRPVARMLDGTQIVEVNRVAVRRDLGSELVAHACSKLYAAAAREAKRRGFARVITYTLESEPGASLRGVGWEVRAKTRGGSWSRPGRPRTDKGPTCRKLRWERDLRPFDEKSAA